MKLAKPKLVSITGADDNASLGNLIALTKRYRNIEWAVLYDGTRHYKPRYPSRFFRDCLLEYYNEKLAIHLDGASLFQALWDNHDRKVHLEQARKFGRCQVNIDTALDFCDTQKQAIYHMVLDHCECIVLHYNDHTKRSIENFLGTLGCKDLQRTHILFDHTTPTNNKNKTWSEECTKFPLHFTGYTGDASAGDLPEQYSQMAKQHTSASQGYWVGIGEGVYTRDQLNYSKISQAMDLLHTEPSVAVH